MISDSGLVFGQPCAFVNWCC